MLDIAGGKEKSRSSNLAANIDKKMELFLDREIPILLPDTEVDPKADSLSQSNLVKVIKAAVISSIHRFGEKAVTLAKDDLEGFFFERTECFVSELILYLKSPYQTLESFDRNMFYTIDGKPPPAKPMKMKSEDDEEPEESVWIEDSASDGQEEDDKVESDSDSKTPEKKDRFLRSDYIVVDDDIDDETAMRLRPSKNYSSTANVQKRGRPMEYQSAGNEAEGTSLRNHKKPRKQ